MLLRGVVSPEVTLESLPEDERAMAAELFRAVDLDASVEIGVAVEKDFYPVGALFASCEDAGMKAELRRTWLKANYIRIVTRILKTRSEMSTVCSSWTFVPAISIEALPCQEKARAMGVYGAVTREVEGEIARTTEETWRSYALNFGGNMSFDLMEKVKQQWLAAKYVDIVEGIVTGSRICLESLENETEIIVLPRGSVRPRETGVTIEVAEELFSPQRKIPRRGNEASPRIYTRQRGEMKVWCAADMHAPES